MSEFPKQSEKIFRIEDLMDDKTNKNNSQNRTSNDIPKNQKVFGHNKRIKP